MTRSRPGISVGVVAAIFGMACGGNLETPDASTDTGEDGVRADVGDDGDADAAMDVADDASPGNDADLADGSDGPDPRCPPFEPTPAPEDLYIVVDRTAIMAPYLDEVKATLAALLQRLPATFPDIAVGLDYFPTKEDVVVCETPKSVVVPMMPLSSGLSVLQSTLAALVSGGTADILASSVDSYVRAQDWSLAHPGRHSSVLLATAATNTNSCDELGGDAVNELGQIARGFFNAGTDWFSSLPGNSVSTFALGVGDDRTMYSFTVGGDVVMLAGDADANAQAIVSALASHARCTLPLPVQDRSPQSLSTVNVQLASALGVELLDQLWDPFLCGDGWFYNAAKNPLMVSLCPATCARLLELPAGRVEFTVGCPSRCGQTCQDGIDNNRNGLIDLADPMCRYSCLPEGRIE